MSVEETVIDEVETKLHVEAVTAAFNRAEDLKTKLENLLKLDLAKAKADLEKGIAYFEGEVARIEAKIHPKVLPLVQAGVPAEHAINLAKQNVTVEDLVKQQGQQTPQKQLIVN
jgi:hypothetical protein